MCERAFLMLPASICSLTQSLQIVPAEAPDTEKQEQAIPAEPFPNSQPGFHEHNEMVLVWDGLF